MYDCLSRKALFKLVVTFPPFLMASTTATIRVILEIRKLTNGMGVL